MDVGQDLTYWLQRRVGPATGSLASLFGESAETGERANAATAPVYFENSTHTTRMPHERVVT